MADLIHGATCPIADPGREVSINQVDIIDCSARARRAAEQRGQRKGSGIQRIFGETKVYRRERRSQKTSSARQVTGLLFEIPGVVAILQH